MSNLANCLGQTRVVALRLGIRGTLIPRYQQWPPAPLQVMQGPAGGAKDSSGGIDLLKINDRALPLALEVGDGTP
jgi:hypothetical protein